MKSTSRTFLAATGEQWALLAALPLNQAGNTALFTVLGPFRAAFDLDYSQLGIVLAAYGFARFISNVPVGLLIRRAPLRAIVVAGITLNILAAALAIGATEVWQVIVSRCLQGVCASIVQATILAWLVIGARAANRGRVMALSEVFFSIVSLTAPLSTGALAALLGWRAAFTIAALGGVVALAAVLIGTQGAPAPSVAEVTGGSSHMKTGSWRAVMAGGNTLVAAYVLTFVVSFGRYGLLNTLLPVIGSDEIGLSPLQVGLALTMANLVGIGMLMIGGWAGDRFGRQRLAVPGVALLLATQAALFALHGEALYFVIVAAQGFGYLINSYPTSLVGDALPAHLRSVGVAGYRIVVDGAILLAPVVVGYASDRGGFGAPRSLTVAVTAVALIAIWLTNRRPAATPVGAARAGPPPSLAEAP